LFSEAGGGPFQTTVSRRQNLETTYKHCSNYQS
jgi:hypothetical protein